MYPEAKLTRREGVAKTRADLDHWTTKLTQAAARLGGGAAAQPRNDRPEPVRVRETNGAV